MSWLRRLRPRKVLLFCDYYADPVWTYRRRRGLPVDALPLSDMTKAALKSWAASYDEGLEPGFERLEPDVDEQVDAEFEREGRRLWRIVQEELGPTWKVGYLSEAEGRILW